MTMENEPRGPATPWPGRPAVRRAAAPDAAAAPRRRPRTGPRSRKQAWASPPRRSRRTPTSVTGRPDAARPVAATCVAGAPPVVARAAVTTRFAAVARIAALAVALAVALGGCGGGGPAGAAAPARGDAPLTGSTSGGTPPAAGSVTASGRPSATVSGQGTPPPANDSQAAAAGIVTAYFREINAASRAGRVAAVGALALPGCQACALDVGVTRDLQQRGLRADTDPYAISAVAALPRQGLACAVTFDVTTSTISLVDPAGRPVGQAPGAPARAGTAELALSDAGWRIQTIRYARRQP